MSRPTGSFATALLAAALFTGVSEADPRDAAPRPLSAPSARDALEIARAHWFGAAATRRARGSDDEFPLALRRATPSGVTSIVLRQMREGLEVYKGSLAAQIDREGRILRSDDRSRARRGTRQSASAMATLPAEEAAVEALRACGLEPDEAVVALEEPEGRDLRGTLSGGGVAREPIRARLMWLGAADAEPDRAEDAVVWNFWIEARDRPGAWEVNIDAGTGEVLTRANRALHDSYRVYAPPYANPLDGDRTLEVDPADPLASPFAWHDINGQAGAESTRTSGNNAFVAEDADGVDATLGASPEGGVGRDFDFALDLADDAADYEAASITNAFYWTSWLHDAFYAFGFDEASGNFQVSQNGNPTLSASSDAVLVDVQDGRDTLDAELRNNAIFTTPADGNSPRMELFLWYDAGPRVEAMGPAAVAGEYPALAARFGPALTSVGVSGLLVAALDTVEPGGTVRDGCSTFTNPGMMAGNIALIDRGQCDFVDKIRNAQAAGAAGAIVVNDRSSELVTMCVYLDADSLCDQVGDVTIPSLFLGRHNGKQLDAALDEEVAVRLFAPATARVQDAGLANDVIAHEYGHGVSNRLTGGGFTTSCLDDEQATGMGEGWSDFFGLVLTAKAHETRIDARGIGTFLLAEARGGAGIRRHPYAPDLSVNPLTYANVADAVIAPPIADDDFDEHEAGEIWASALWEVYWNLVDAHGFAPDLALGYTGEGDGNALALQLVIDGLALQPCEPTFLEARDAILQADLALTGGINACHVWRGFAKRGMGLSAYDGGVAASVAVVEAFDVPEACPEPAAPILQACVLLVAGSLRRTRLLRSRRRPGSR